MIYQIFNNPAQGLAVFFMLILALSVHEMAHAWMALKRGDDTAARMGRLTLNPAAHLDPMGLFFIMFAFFGWGKPVPYNPSNLKDVQRDSMLIALAGPMSNILQAIILAVVWRLIFTEMIGGAILNMPNGEGVHQAAQTVLFWGIYINLILAFFNLIPLFPLDGEKILSGFLPFEQAIKFQEFRKHSMMVLFLLLMTGFFLPGHISILEWYFRFTALPIASLLTGI